MKKMIVLVGLLSAFTIKAQTYERMPVVDLIPVENMYAAFELKTPNYEKVILDCQSFIHNVNFYKNSKIIHNVSMVDYVTCDAIHDFIIQSQMNNKPVCMEILEGGKDLNLSNEEAIDCQ